MKTISELIDMMGGPTKAAQALDVSPQVITNWKARGSIPGIGTLPYARAILQATEANGHLLTYEDIIE